MFLLSGILTCDRVMQYANFGFAFGFLLISLIIPLDYSFYESRISCQDGSCRDQSEPCTPESPASNDCRSQSHWIWNHVLADIDLFDRIISGRVRGYRRITADNVLNHKIR